MVSTAADTEVSGVSRLKTTPAAILLGTTVHRSVLLHRAAACGLRSTDDFSAEAIRRGCHYYAPPGMLPSPSSGKTAAGLSNEDLALCLLHPALPPDPQRIRLGAAMLAARENDPAIVARRAVQERAERIVTYIARAGLSYEPDNSFWPTLLSLLPACEPIPDGILPHRTRFVALTGRRAPGLPRGPHAEWIRPFPSAA